MRRVDLKYILTNGCSWVEGTGLEHELAIQKGCKSFEEVSDWKVKYPKSLQIKYTHKNRMPTMIANKLGLKEYNIGQAGKSNDCIVRTTVEWILNNKEKANETLFYIQWSNPHRTEFLEAFENQYFVNNWFSPTTSGRYHVHILDRYEKYFVQPISLELNTLNSVINLQNFLKVNNFKYAFVDALGKIWDIPSVDDISEPLKNTRVQRSYGKFENSVKLYKDLLDLIDVDKFYAKKDLTNCIADKVYKGKVPTPSNMIGRDTEWIKWDGHPSSITNNIFSDLIVDFIKEKIL